MTTTADQPLPGTPAKPRGRYRLFLYVFLLSLVVRVLWVAHASVSPIGDHYGYNRSAIEWLHTGEYRVQGRLYAYKPPGYPALVALIYKAFGQDWRMLSSEQAALWQRLGPVLSHDWKVVGFVQALMGALVSGMLAALAGRLLSVRVGAIAGLLHAFWPTAIAFVPVLANDNLAVFLLILGLLCLVHARDGRGFGPAALACVAGVCYGGMLLVRPSAIFFLPAWLILAYWDVPGRVRRGRVLLLCMVTMGLIVGPWLYRTYSLGFGLGTFSTQGGYGLWWGNNWRSIDGGNPAPPRFPGDRELSEAEQHKFFMRKALDWIADNPQRYLALSRVRFMRFIGKQQDVWAAKYFFPTYENDRLLRAVYWKKTADAEDVEKGRALERRNRTHHMRFRLVAAPLMAVSLLLALTRPRKFLVFLLPLAGYVAGHAFTVFAGRYRVTSDPLILVCLASYLSGVIFRAESGGFWRGRWPKLALGLLAIAGSIYVHVSKFDKGWYRLPRLPEPQPEFSSALGFCTGLDLSSRASVRSSATKTCKLDLARTEDGLRCDLRGTPAETGFQYGGISLPADGLIAVRLDLTWRDPHNIDAVFVDGRDAEEKIAVRWEWRPRAQGLHRMMSGRQTYVLVAGQHSGYFRSRTHDPARRVAELRLLVRVIRNTAAGFVLHDVAIALAQPEVLVEDCVPVDIPPPEALEPVENRTTAVEFISDPAGLHCDIVGGDDTSGGQYGGFSFPVSLTAALRPEFSFRHEKNIMGMWVDGYDRERRRVLRWAWDFRRSGYPLPGPQTYVLVPGRPFGPFEPRDEVLPEAVDRLLIQIRVEPGRAAGFTLHGLEQCRTVPGAAAR